MTGVQTCALPICGFVMVVAIGAVVAVVVGGRYCGSDGCGFV